MTTRNVRLAAIHAFFRFVGSYHPEQLDRVQRILGIPFKRARQRVIEYLERDEIEAVLSRISRTSRDGHCDYTLLATMFNTGARVQEIVDLRARDLQLIRPFQNPALRQRQERTVLSLVATNRADAPRSL